MKISSSHLKTVGGLLLSGGTNLLLASGTGGFLLPFSSTISELVRSITANIASNHIAKLSNDSFDRLAERISKSETDPNNINHDLERLFKKSSIIALKFIKALYLKGYKDDKTFFSIIRQNFSSQKNDKREKLYKQIILFFNDQIKFIEEDIIKQNTINISEEDIKAPTEFLKIFVQKIFDNVYTDLPDSEIELLKAFYIENIPYCFELAFKESLKHDNLGFKAFQIWVLEDLQTQNNNNTAALQEISDAIKKLKRGEFIDKKEQEAKWEKLSNKIYDILGVNLSGIREEFIELSKQFTKKLDEVDERLDRINKKLSTVQEDVNNGFKSIDNNFDHTINILNQGFGNLTSILKETQAQPIEHKLSSPLRPEVFIGRRDDIQKIRNHFLVGERKFPFLLISGFGGLGKTSLASEYFHEYHSEYSHVAWILGKENFKDKLLSLSESVNLSHSTPLSEDEKLKELIKKLTNLPKPCLLIIDNIDDINDLKQITKLLGSLSNFDILITTRINEFETIDFYHLDKLTKVNGLKLFKCHYKYHQPEEDELFYGIFDSIFGNTKIIELLSKKLNIENRNKEKYPLSKLLEELRSKGVLGLNSKTIIESEIEGTIQEIIMAMYEISNLNEIQTKILCTFSILPAEGIRYSILEQLLFYIGNIDEDLDYLYKSGWIEKQRENRESVYKTSPLIQDIIKKKIESRLIYENALPLINSVLKCNELDSSIRLKFLLSIHENLNTDIEGIEKIGIELMDNSTKEILARFYHTIAIDSQNALKQHKFISKSIAFFESIPVIDKLKSKLEEKLYQKEADETFEGFKQRLTPEELDTIEYYNNDALHAMAKIKFGLEQLKSAEHYFLLIYDLASRFPNLTFDAFEYNRYLSMAGRETEAEAYFFKTYKKNKNTLLAILEEKERRNINIRVSENVYNFKALCKEDLRTVEYALSFSGVSSLELAKLFRRQGRFEEALYFHDKSIKLEHLREDVNNQNLSICSHSLAITYLMKGGDNQEEAGKLLDKIYNFYKENYGDEHINFGYFYEDKFNIAIKNNEEINVCLENYNKAKNIFTQNLGNESSHILQLNIKFYNYLKSNSTEQNIKNELEEKIIQSFTSKLENTIERFGIHNPYLHQGMILAAEILNNQNKIKEAEALVNKRMEFMRIKTLRTEVRSFDLPIREIKDNEEKKTIIKLLKPITSLPANISEFDINIIELPFYKNYDLCKIKIKTSQSDIYKHVLISEQDAKSLGTTNDTIYDLGENDLQLDNNSVKYYTTFFFDNVVGRLGKFYILKEGNQIPWRKDIVIEQEFKTKVQNLITPLKLISQNDEHIRLNSYIIFKDALFKSDILVNFHNGQLTLTDEDQILIDISKNNFAFVERKNEKTYRQLNPNCKLIDSIPACMDPIHYSSIEVL